MNITLDKMKESVVSEKEAIIFLIVDKDAISQRKLADTLGMSTTNIRRIHSKVRKAVDNSV